MNTRLLTFLLTISLALAAVSAPPTYVMSPIDGYQGTKEVEGPLLFYDNGGPNGKTKTAVTGYKIFKAANEGESLTLTFQSPVNFSHYLTHIFIYEGDCRYAGGVTGSPDGWKKEVPTGYLADITNGRQGTFTFPSGVCSVLYYCPTYYETGTGWEALLTTDAGSVMTLEGIRGIQDRTDDVYPSLRDLELLAVDVKTTGGINPMHLTRLVFELDGTLSPEMLENIRCEYQGSSREPKGAVLMGSVYMRGKTRLTFEGDMTLAGGSNYFSLRGNIMDSGLPETTLDASLVSAVIDGTERIITPVSPPAVMILKNMLPMEPGDHTYVLEDWPRNFYDDGGPDNPYKQYFSGTAHFVPGVPGKKVRIDFTKLALYTSQQAIAAGNADKIKVYNGMDTTAANLIAIIERNEPRMISSTDTDGTLTVKFESLYYRPAQGFEALLSLYEPSPMYVDKVSVDVATSATVNAGDREAKILAINIHTRENTPALQLNNLTARALGNPGIVTGASLLSYGSDSRTGAAHEIARCTVNDENMLILSPEQNIKLGEGDNYFVIALQVSPRALRKQSVGCKLMSLLTDTKTELEGDSAIRTVANEYRSVPGWGDITLYDQWSYCNSTPANDYYGYEGEEGNQIVTFRPSTQGAKVEMTLDEFILSWPQVSSIVGPYFRIYNGASPLAEVLWQVSKENKEAWPRTPIRSSSADGALTILFNPMGNRGEHGAGFRARVYEVDGRPAFVSAIEGFTATNHAVEPGSIDEPVAGLAFTVEGTGQPPVINSLALNLKGGQPNINTIKIYSTGHERNFDSSERVLIGTAVPSAIQSTTVVNLQNPAVLNERLTYLWVACDISEQAHSGDTLDVSFVAVESTSELPPVTNPDPDGEREIRRTVRMTDKHQAVEVKEPIYFYDDGGADGPCTSASEGSITFTPPADKAIRLSFRNFHISPNDNFYIYDGTDTTGAPRKLLWGLCENLTPLRSNDPQGSLTVQLRKKSSTKFDGWEILVEPVEQVPLSIEQVESESASKEFMYRGSLDNGLLRVAISLDGNYGSVPVDALVLEDSVPAQVDSLKIYYTGHDNRFYTDRCVGRSNRDLSISTEGLTLEGAGVHYLWLSCDVAPDALRGRHVTTRLAGVRNGHNFLRPTVSRLVDRRIGKGLAGIFTLSKTKEADYHSFQEVVDEMQATGVEDSVVINVMPGVWAEQILIDAIPGAGHRNKIIFRGMPGSEKVLVSPANIVVRQDTVSAPLVMMHASGIRFENISFNGKDWEAAAALTACSDICFDNCVFSGAEKGILFADTTVRCTVRHCRFAGLADTGNSYIGIENVGFEEENMIEANMFSVGNNETSVGIKWRAVSALTKLINNEICTYGRVNTRVVRGMAFDMCGGTPVLANNTILLSSASSASRAVEFLGDTGSPLLVNNIFACPVNGSSIVSEHEELFRKESIQHNLFYSESGKTAISGSRQYSFEQWQSLFPTSIGEKPIYRADSVPDLMLPGNLRSGLSLPYVPEDLIGIARPLSGVTLGCTEYISSEGGPEALPGYPKVVWCGPEAATIETGSRHYAKMQLAVVPASDSNPDATAFAQSDTVLMRPGFKRRIVIGGLQPDTRYRAWMKLTDGDRDTSSTFPSSVFTTPDKLGPLSPLKLIVPTEVSGSEEGAFTVEAVASGGESPYKFRWTDCNGVLLGESAQLSSMVHHPQRIRVEVTDARLKKATAYTTIIAGDSLRPATFEDWCLEPEDIWIGDTVKGYDTEQTVYSGSFRFPNLYMHAYRSWAKFAVSSMSDDWYLSLPDQFNSSSGRGACNSNTFGVAYIEPAYGETAFEVSKAGTDIDMRGIWLNNSAWVKEAVLYGDGMSTIEGGFTNGDWFRLTLTGVRTNGSGITKDIYLADYRDEDVRNHYVIDSWQWFDLSAFGPIHKISFSVAGTKKNQFGLTTPAYVCLDGIGSQCPARLADTLVLSRTNGNTSPLWINPMPYFSFKDSEADVSVSLLRDSGCASVQNGMIRVEADKDSLFTLLVQGVQKGRREYIMLPVQLDSGGSVSSVANQFRIGPTPFADYLDIFTGNGSVYATLYGIDGKIYAAKGSEDGEVRLQTQGLTPGVYILHLHTSSGLITRKIIKK